MSLPSVLPVAVSTSTSFKYASNTDKPSASSVSSIVGDVRLCPYFSAIRTSGRPVRMNDSSPSSSAMSTISSITSIVGLRPNRNTKFRFLAYCIGVLSTTASGSTTPASFSICILIPWSSPGWFVVANFHASDSDCVIRLV